VSQFTTSECVGSHLEPRLLSAQVGHPLSTEICLAWCLRTRNIDRAFAGILDVVQVPAPPHWNACRPALGIALRRTQVQTWEPGNRRDHRCDKVEVFWMSGAWLQRTT